MNAKNVTPDETAPEQPTAVETPTTADGVSSPDFSSESAVGTNAEPVVVTTATPAHKAVTPADEVVLTEVSTPVESRATGEVTPVASGATGEVAHVASGATGEITPVVSSATGEVTPVHAPVQTVYVTAPTPPRPKGNRGVGILMSVLAAVVFAAVYVGIVAILLLSLDPNVVASALSSFVVSPLFFIPVLAFLVVMSLWALLANRASWWSWVIGSFVIAAVTYFASIGVFLLIQGGFGMTASAATAEFQRLAISPALIAAALIARECAIWFGAVIAKRGRKVRERNYDAWQSFEHEEAQKRAEFGGASAA